MPLTLGTAAVDAVYVGDTPATAVYVGDTQVWPDPADQEGATVA